MLLTESVHLGGVDAPSRVLFGPHETNLARRRAISERQVAYYARRAAGGTGVIVTEAASVHVSDWPYERAPLAADCRNGWSDVAAACRPHGTVVLAGLGHTGLQGSSAFSQSALWAPSRVADAASRELPVPMEGADVTALIAGFASAAAAAVQAGLHGVEIDAGPFSLLRQFHSALTNKREDDYGTDRTRLTREVLAAVREWAGDHAVIGLRLCCDELAPWAGVTPEHAAAHIAEFAPLTDLIVVVQGGPFTTQLYRPTAHAPSGHTVELCRQMRATAAGAVPVVLQGGVVDPGQAQWALDDGVADLVEMTRAQIADAALVAKVRRGAAVRPCVRCNQTCRVRDNRNPIVTCIGDPRSGHETEDPDVEAATLTPHGIRAALVVGAGPAGLETARVLAAHGVRVRVVDRAARAGGVVPAAAGLPGHEPSGELAGWLTDECVRLGAQLDLGVGVDAGDVAAADAQGVAVVLATGSVDAPRDYPVAADAPVWSALALLSGATLPDGPVVVLDPIGGPVGVGVCELLQAAGRAVSVVTQDQIVGTQLSLTGDLADANARLLRAGVTRVLSSIVRGVDSTGVQIENRWTGDRTMVPAAAVIDCGHRLPEQALWSALPADIRRQVHRAGDCVAPRTVLEAVLEGRRVALALLAARPSAQARPAPRQFESAPA